MRQAIVSDIHGNYIALQAVLKDIESQNVESIVCLGDLVGYGPQPRECVDESMKFDFTILGNHEQAVLEEPDGFGPVALQSIHYSRDLLKDGTGESSNRNRLEYLRGLPRYHREGDLLYVHASPRHPTYEYVFPEYVYDLKKMELLFSRISGVCFQGHTHIPGVFTEQLTFLSPADCNNQYTVGSEKLMVNVGSVGQPRDEDCRSCYVVYDVAAKTIEFRRVQYDVDATAELIYCEEQLADFLGDRIKTGR